MFGYCVGMYGDGVRVRILCKCVCIPFCAGVRWDVAVHPAGVFWDVAVHPPRRTESA